jgi:hypothetical protein
MRRSRIAVTALLCGSLAGCFEEPIRDHLHLTVSGSVVLTTVQEVAEPEVGSQYLDPRYLIDQAEGTLPR